MKRRSKFTFKNDAKHNVGNIEKVKNLFNLGNQHNMTEIQKQAEFYKLTGVDCCPEAREWFEWLAENSVITHKEVASVWNGRAARWYPGDEEPKFDRRIDDRIFTAIGLAGLSGIFSLFLWFAMSLPKPQSTAFVVASFSFGLILVAAVYFADKWLITPQRIAKRIRAFQGGYFDDAEGAAE